MTKKKVDYAVEIVEYWKLGETASLALVNVHKICRPADLPPQAKVWNMGYALLHLFLILMQSVELTLKAADKKRQVKGTSALASLSMLWYYKDQ